jgi:hypothetical protein
MEQRRHRQQCKEELRHLRRHEKARRKRERRLAQRAKIGVAAFLTQTSEDNEGPRAERRTERRARLGPAVDVVISRRVFRSPLVASAKTPVSPPRAPPAKDGTRVASVVSPAAAEEKIATPTTQSDAAGAETCAGDAAGPSAPPTPPSDANALEREPTDNDADEYDDDFEDDDDENEEEAVVVKNEAGGGSAAAEVGIEAVASARPRDTAHAGRGSREDDGFVLVDRPGTGAIVHTNDGVVVF